MALNKGILALLAIVTFLMVAALSAGAAENELRGTGDLGLVIEREAGRVAIVDTTNREVLGKVEGLGDLSHASAVFDRSGRFSYVFGRDGGLTKVDLLTQTIAKRVVQAGNSIGGAISQDGQLIAVSNYEPGGVKIFEPNLGLVADIPARYGDDGSTSKVVGLVDAPGQRFVFSLYDGGQIWSADLSDPSAPAIEKYEKIGVQPYDGLITPDGRHYLAGLFGEDGIALLDLWHEDKGPNRILDGYGRGEEPLPVYKMPHLEGWAAAGDLLFLPAVGRHELLVVDRRTFEEKGRIAVHGQPIFAVARPDGRQVWVNFAHPSNDTIQVIDVPSLSIIKSFKPGKVALHMEFTPRGEAVWISVRDEDRVDVYDTASFDRIATLAIDKPSGIFFTARANRIGL
ncbi:MAG: protein nirF [Alphaproteobacteria bacterium]|nr:protein nirF [Alphaproteobacteria bacterium]